MEEPSGDLSIFYQLFTPISSFINLSGEIYDNFYTKEGTLSSIQDAIDDLSGVYTSITSFINLSGEIYDNFYTKEDADMAINSSIYDYGLLHYAPIDIVTNLSENYFTRWATISSIQDAIDDLSGFYTPITGFNEFKNDVITGYLTNADAIATYALSSNVYNKNETYTREEISAAIANAGHIKKRVEQSLPNVADADEDTIYLIPNSEQISQNIHDEYILINNQWECIGNTAIDITNYANLNNANTFLNDQTISGDLTVTNDLNVLSTVIAQSGYFVQDLKIATRSINSYLDYIDFLYQEHVSGYDIKTLSSTTFIPINEEVYKHTLSNNDVITFTTIYFSSTKMLSFELHLIQPSTPVSFTFSNSIKWIDDLNFNSSNLPPDFSEGNTLYAIVFRWDGTELLANLAYTKDIE